MVPETRGVHVEAGGAVPIVEHVDVLVAGGGPAGVAAAITAGRAGARVRLIETHGCLGGVWTTGLLSYILDGRNKPGIMREIIARLQAQSDAGAAQWGGHAYDVEAMKLLLERLCLDAGVDVRLHTRVVAAARDASNRLAVCVTESKSGREAWSGEVFIDCTGDGDLAAQAGCGFAVGHPETGQTQPMTLMAYLSGIHLDDIRPYVNLERDGERFGTDAKRLRDLLKRVNIEPSYAAPMLLHIHDNLFAMMSNHAYHYSGLSAQDLTEATIRTREEVHRIVAGLRQLGGAWATLRLVGTAAQIGVREGRRIEGRYTLTADDLVRGARFDDAVCRCTFPVDVHSLDPAAGKAYGNQGVRAQPYDIPFRALVAHGIDGLLLAGRCISGDFIAHSSYRVTGNAVAMGQAAGAAAAVAVRQKRLPHELDYPRDVAPVIEAIDAVRRDPNPSR